MCWVVATDVCVYVRLMLRPLTCLPGPAWLEEQRFLDDTCVMRSSKSHDSCGRIARQPAPGVGVTASRDFRNRCCRVARENPDAASVGFADGPQGDVVAPGSGCREGKQVALAARRELGCGYGGHEVKELQVGGQVGPCGRPDGVMLLLVSMECISQRTELAGAIFGCVNGPKPEELDAVCEKPLFPKRTRELTVLGEHFLDGGGGKHTGWSMHALFLEPVTANERRPPPTMQNSDGGGPCIRWYACAGLGAPMAGICSEWSLAQSACVRTFTAGRGMG